MRRRLILHGHLKDLCPEVIEVIADTAAEAFNALMIEKAGVVGVPFGTYIRYGVCGDTAAMAPELHKAFSEAKVSYN